MKVKEGENQREIGAADKRKPGNQKKSREKERG